MTGVLPNPHSTPQPLKFLRNAPHARTSPPAPRLNRVHLVLLNATRWLVVESPLTLSLPPPSDSGHSMHEETVAGIRIRLHRFTPHDFAPVFLFSSTLE